MLIEEGANQTHTFAPELNLDTLLGRYASCGYVVIYEASPSGRPGELLGNIETDAEGLRARLFLTEENPDERALIDALRRAAEMEMRLLTVERHRRFIVIGRGPKGTGQIFQRLVQCISTSPNGMPEQAEMQPAFGIAEADSAAVPAGVRSIHGSLLLVSESIQTALALTTGMYAGVIAQKDRMIEQAFSLNRDLSKENATLHARAAALEQDLAQIGVVPRRSDSLEKAGAFLKETLGSMSGAAALWGLVPQEIKEKLTPENLKALQGKMKDPTTQALFMSFLTPGATE